MFTRDYAQDVPLQQYVFILWKVKGALKEKTGTENRKNEESVK